MKKKFMAYLFVTIALTSLIITFLIGAYAKSIIGAHIETIKNDIASRLENQFEIYDDFLLLVENDMKEKAESALLTLVSKFPDYEVTVKMTPAELKKIALQVGVDEIYFINRDCVVYNSSFETDLNLDLKKAFDFAPFLKSIFDRNEPVFHRISNSMLTGALNLYGYYGPKNSGFIIEISVCVNKYLNKVAPDFWQGVLKNIFHSQIGRSSYLKNIDVYVPVENGLWSFVNIGKPARIEKRVQDRLMAEKEVRVANGDIVTFYKLMAFENKFESWLPIKVILEMNFDFGVVNGFDYQIMVYSFVVCTVMIILSFVVSSRVLNNYITRRIILIKEALARIAAGDYTAVAADDGAGDEISEIASGVNALGEKIASHVSSLEDMIPICASCKKIRDDSGFWQQVEGYLSKRSGMKFTHGMCPECTKKYYPEYYAKKIASQSASSGDSRKV